MDKSLNILVIEDVESDYELVLREVRKGWEVINSKRIETPEEFEKELQGNWDVICSDNSLPRFDASSALKQLRALDEDMPFIIVSGTITEELAVTAMRHGANDYVLKGNLNRLVPVIEREVRDYERRKKYEKTEEKLSITQHRYELLAQNIQDLVALHKPDSTYLWLSPSVERILGYDANDLVGKKHFDFIHPEDFSAEKFEDPFKKFDGESLRRFTYRMKRSDDTYIYLETLLKPLRSNDGKLTQILSTSRDITEQQLAYDLLTESEERYHGVINTIAEGVVLYNNKGDVITYNPSAERLLGIKIDDMRSSRDTLFKKYSLIREDHSEFREEEFPSNVTLKTGEPRFETQMGLKEKSGDNKIKWISINSVPFTEPDGKVGVVVSFSDITTQKQSKDQIAAAVTELRSLIENANAPIFGIDWHGRINEWNQVCASITGFKKEEVLGKGLISEFILDGYKVSVTDLLKSALRGKAVSNYELPIYTRTGQVVTILFNATPRKNAEGNIHGVLGVGQDITELIQYRDKLEHRVAERTEKLNKALESQKELVALKSKFVSMASHEFRTPLSTITFAADFVKKYSSKLSEAEREKKLSKIEEQVKHMTMLLDDVLVMGKSEAGKIKLNPSEVNLKDFVKKLVEEVEHSAHNTHKVMLSVAAQQDRIYVDEKLLRNILINLLSNAIKFSPGQKKVLLDVIYKDRILNIKVKDWGMGIEEEDREKIFEAFHRSSSVGTIQGTGLGLAIVKKAIDMHNGSITVDTELGKGTTFTIEMPLDYENITY